MTAHERRPAALAEWTARPIAGIISATYKATTFFATGQFFYFRRCFTTLYFCALRAVLVSPSLESEMLSCEKVGSLGDIKAALFVLNSWAKTNWELCNG